MGKKEDQEAHADERIEQTGQLTLDCGQESSAIHLLTIIGEIEGHDNLGNSSKTTKYEHVLPQLAAIEDSSQPTVSLVLGGSHSIGVPIAVSTDYSFIVPTGTMVIHPVRMNGTVIGAPQTFDYFKQIQDRITGFVCGHCNVTQPRMEALMMNQGMLTKDLGTILVGREAVREGIISEVGGISDAMKKLHSLMGHTSDGQKKKNSNSDKKRIKCYGSICTKGQKKAFCLRQKQFTEEKKRFLFQTERCTDTGAERDRQ